MKTPILIGQLWKDNDSRTMYPFFEIVGFDGDKAICKKRRNGKEFNVKISTSRLINTSGSRSYRLVKDVESK